MLDRGDDAWRRCAGAASSDGRPAAGFVDHGRGRPDRRAVPGGFHDIAGEVRFGRADFSSVPMIDVLMITVQTNRSLDAGGVIELLSESGLEP
ncbi:MAG: hypothetical protein V3S08_05270 [Phycisphaerales bacterium]